MLYHYTSINAFKSILKDARTQMLMCFWATRYDCFADKEELKLGVETIKRLLPQVEKSLPSDRQIASSFDWGKIRGNENLPFPYIVSFTSRPDNSYMWKEYAKSDGIVMEIDDSLNFHTQESLMMRLCSCIYADENSDEKLVNMLREEYSSLGYALLKGPHKDVAFYLLKNNPQSFVALIAMGLFSFVAPRIKQAKDYWMEEETRTIIPIPMPAYNKKIEGFDDIIEKLGISPTLLRKHVLDEYSRKRDDGSTLYYRKLLLPINILKGIYVKNNKTKECIGAFLKEIKITIPIIQID